MHLFWELGLISYDKAWELQRTLHRKRVNNQVSDVVLLVEHPATITAGKSGRMANVLASRERLLVEDASLFFIKGKGDVSYYGPGQIVGYPIIDLRERGKDLRKFVHDIEEVIIRTMGDFMIEAERDEDHLGIWVDDEQIARIELGLSRWVSTHGFSINVDPDLEHFSLINSCGFSRKKTISMARLIGTALPAEEVQGRLVGHFCKIFDISTI
jgi:lipoate-protein ligase B